MKMEKGVLAFLVIMYVEAEKKKRIYIYIYSIFLLVIDVLTGFWSYACGLMMRWINLEIGWIQYMSMKAMTLVK